MFESSITTTSLTIKMTEITTKPKTTTFETKCYENDWVYILNNNYLENNIKNCRYQFDKKILYLNNFSNYNRVKRRADQLVSKGVIDEYYVVEDYAKETLQHFNLTIEDFKGGYYYSIAEMVSIFMSKTDYILHFSGDSSLRDSPNPFWIEQAIKIIGSNKNILVANPTWNSNYEEAKAESFKEDEDWYQGYGFSDQCYLIRTEDFKKQILHFTHPDSERYPKYGGELFEKRIDAYMRAKGLFRITNKHCSYVHENFPKMKASASSKFLKKMIHKLTVLKS